MKPYYQDDAVTIYHGDCREILPLFDDNRFALVHTDPPFGVGNFVQTTGKIRGRGVNSGRAVEWNDCAPDSSVFDQIRRVSRHRIIWGANFFNCFEPLGGAIVWVKNQSMPNFSKADVASCTHFKKTEVVEYAWTNYAVAARAVSDHPCERPIELYMWCLGYIPGAREGDVLDPFAGSGTTGRAAKDLGRKAVLIEREERYCEIAAKRMAQEVLPIFSEETHQMTIDDFSS